MPDEINKEADVASKIFEDAQSDADHLKSIDSSLKQMLGQMKNMSSANAKNRGYISNPWSRSSPFSSSMFSRSGMRGAFGEFTKELEKGMIEEIVGPDFKKALNGIGTTLAKDLGVALEDVPKELGKAAGKRLVNSILGSNGTAGVNSVFSKITDSLGSTYRNAVTKSMQKSMPGWKYPTGSTSSVDVTKLASTAVNATGEVAKLAEGTAQAGAEVASMASTAASAEAATAGMATTAASADAVLTGLTATLGEIAPYLALALVGFKFQMALVKPMKDLGEIAISFVKTMAKAGKRYKETQQNNIKLAQERIKADVETMVKTPFEILNKAAEEWYQAWDSNLKTISATQGYTKADVQALMSTYAERLRNEGLSSYVSSADITGNLAKVLQSGLSGQAAEEFAYIATVLGETIPTPDFFSYASDYASVAANAIAQGKSQTEAINEATQRLVSFADTILYASRATGGLTTGLQNAEGLFRQSVQIANASKLSTTGDIGGVLATVAAVTGAIAPDLAQSMTDAVYRAAIGGNSSEIVALRSLAGINASNTEFLLQLSKNPQKVFATLFTNLARMQNMSNGAFMEVAEGLSSTFGISMDAFARIDFNQLAQAITNFNSNSGSLEENLKLLKSGETTTTAEQLKYQQINKMILDEGLSYVLDSEAGRAIQQHLWDEQLAKEIQEATYAVDLTGSALQLLQDIAMWVNGIKEFITGDFVFHAVSDVLQTVDEMNAQRTDIANLLKQGKVGAGNQTSFSNLVGINQNLGLVPTLIEMMGGESQYGKVYNGYSMAMFGDMLVNSALGADLLSSTHRIPDFMWDMVNDQIMENTVGGGYYGDATNRFSSKYSWSTIAKSSARAAFDTPSGMSSSVGAMISNSDLAQAKASGNLKNMIADMAGFTEGTGSYADWVATAKNYGIGNFAEALSAAGYTESQMKNQFEAYRTQQAIKEEQERKEKESSFWDSSLEFLTNISDYTLKLQESFEDFLKDWREYFIEHKVYNNAYNHDTVNKIMQEERESSESAIYALADALTENDVQLLVDPTLQTNALLGQILKVANAILNQQSTGGAGVTLPDTLSGLALGLSS